MFEGFVRRFGINGLKKDIKKLGVSEDYFLECLNLATNLDIKNIDEIPKDKLKDIEKLVKEMVFHLIALNTVVKDIGEEKIGDGFNFSSANSTRKITRIAGSNNLSSSQVIEYVKNRELYVRMLLDPRLKKKPA